MVEIEISDPSEKAIVAAWAGRSKGATNLAGRPFPPGTRILNHFPSNEGDVRGDGRQMSSKSTKSVVFGIPITPNEAVRRAQQLQHPQTM